MALKVKFGDKLRHPLGLGCGDQSRAAMSCTGLLYNLQHHCAMYSSTMQCTTLLCNVQTYCAVYTSSVQCTSLLCNIIVYCAMYSQCSLLCILQVYCAVYKFTVHFRMMKPFSYQKSSRHTVLLTPVYIMSNPYDSIFRTWSMYHYVNLHIL